MSHSVLMNQWYPILGAIHANDSSKPNRFVLDSNFGFRTQEFLWQEFLASLTGMLDHLHICEGKPIEKIEDTLGSQVLKRALAV